MLAASLASSSMSPSRNIRISLSGTARGYVLQAASDVEVKEWVDNLTKRRKAILAVLKDFDGGRVNPKPNRGRKVALT